MRNRNQGGGSQRRGKSSQGLSSSAKTLIAIGLVVVVGIVAWLSWPAAEYSLPYQGKVRDVAQNGNIIMDNGLTVEVLAADITTDGQNFMKSQIVGKEVKLIADSHDTNPKYKNPTKDKVRAYVEVIDGETEYKDLNGYLVKDARYAKLSSAYCQDRYTTYQRMLEEKPGSGGVDDGSRSVEPRKPTSSFDKTALFRYMAPATFLITVSGPDANGNNVTSYGTGFFINKNGIALTNYHVLSRYIQGRATARIFLCDDKGNITSDRDRPIRRYIAADKNLDWCAFVVSLDNNEQSPYLNLSKVQAKQGVDVGVLGNPNGETATFTAGMISNIHDNRGEIQFDASMYPGNSGGPVCNFYGEVLGIAKSVASDGHGGIATGNMNYGVDIMLVRKALDEMKDVTYYGGK